MRLGEAYLIAAEADARLNGSTTSMQGTQYINMLRNRANATTSTAGYSLSDICDEWSREMGYEAVRRTTLIRFGRFGGQTDYSWAWKGGSYDGTAFDAGMNTYPIPAVEVGSTPEPYAVLSDENTKLTFYYDKHKEQNNGMDVNFTDNTLRGWNSSASYITEVVFDPSFANCTTLTSTAWLFWSMGNLTTITGIENLKTDNVTNMYSMFAYCPKLTSLDVSGFNTSKVTDMGYMFGGCSGLTTLNVSGFNTSNVTNMRNMFDSCTGLTSLDVSSFNTANVTNMSYMFMNCTGLTTLDLSSFNTAKVENMDNMFCQNSLTTIYVDGTKWNTGAVTSSISMFYMCPNLVGGKGTTYDANHVDASYAHIDGGVSNPGYFTDRNASTESNDSIQIVGNKDLSSAWWTAFSKDYVVPADYTLHVQFVNHSAKENNWENWAMICAADTTRTPEYFALRADNYGWGDYHNANGLTINWNDWDAFREGMDGAVVDLTVRRWGSEVRVTSNALTTSGDMLTQVYTTNIDVATEKSIDVFFTVEKSYLEIDNTKTTLTPTVPEIAEAYAVLSGDSILTFYYDNKKEERNGMSVGPFTGATDAPWYIRRGNITKVVFDNSFANCDTLTSTASWFADCHMLATIENLNLLNTANVTDMHEMFYSCDNLTSIDLSNFNTANVTDMGAMFYFCSGLMSLDLSNFNTDKVVSMGSMFENCYRLTSLDVSNFNTANVTNMSRMFLGCSDLTSLDVSGFNTTNVTDMGCMFGGCSGLTSLDVSNFKTDKVTSMGSMFDGCSGLTSLDVTNFKTDKVTSMQMMFIDCLGLTTLDLSGFNTANVTNMSSMFSRCHDLTTIYAGSEWSIAAETVVDGMFYGCWNLVGGMGTVYSEDHVDADYAHIDGGTSNPGYLTLKLAMGDANGDGNINIADAVATVTNILGQPTEAAFYQYAADMNTDQVIDIFDVTLIVNAAFDAASPAPAMTRGSADNIMMEHISMTADANYIYLGIDQPERFTATQFDVTLPEGMELVDARLASATTDHQLTFVKRGNNEYRVIGLSMSNTTFRSMNGQLIKLEVSGSAVDSDVKMSNVLFVTPTATVMTSIDKCLNTAKAADDSLYDLKGQRVSKQQLGKGIYIMNHKKVIIK